MKFLLWEKRFETGVEEIDQRHLHEIEMINRVHKSVVGESARDQIEHEMASFINDVEEHFQHEEQVMEQHAYPALDEHKDEHHRLLEALRTHQHEFKSGSMTPAYEFLEVSHSWFIRHLDGHDHDMGIYLSGINSEID